jgi:hypothetical protein
MPVALASSPHVSSDKSMADNSSPNYKSLFLQAEERLKQAEDKGRRGRERSRRIVEFMKYRLMEARFVRSEPLRGCFREGGLSTVYHYY